MNRIINRAKKNITAQKKKYLFLVTIILIGIISGFLFIFFISKEDKSLVKLELENFFNYIKLNDINYFDSLINSVSSNLLYLIIIWILGISIVGMPVIIFLLFFKGFVFGFSFSSIVVNYGVKGFLLATGYQMPHHLLMLACIILLGFYAINFSVRLFRILFLKENINLSMYFKKYNKIFLICIFIGLLCSILETFLSPVLINLFL